MGIFDDNKKRPDGRFQFMAVPTGFEPAISALTGRHVEPSYTTGPADNSLP